MSAGRHYRGNFTRSSGEMDRWHARHPPEAALEPGLEIIDAHHHLMDSEALRIDYPAAAYLADAGGGHHIVATVLVESRTRYRTDGPEALRPLGEVAFAREMAEHTAEGPCQLAAAIVGRANLLLGAEVDAVLEASIEAAGGRYRGVRHPATFHDGEIGLAAPSPVAPHLLASSAFRAGYARLAAYRLSFDAWIFHTQLRELAELADAFAHVPIALDHIGGLLGVGPYESQRGPTFERWRQDMAELARRPNVVVKIGGLGMPMFGWGFDHHETPPSSIELARAWRPYVETCIDLFGPQRCMFESNFPVDKQSCGYTACWNAFKRLTHGCSTEERHALFFDSARRFYRPQLNSTPPAA